MKFTLFAALKKNDRGYYGTAAGLLLIMQYAPSMFDLIFFGISGWCRCDAPLPADQVYNKEYSSADKTAEYYRQDAEIEITLAQDLPENNTDGSGND